MVKELLNYQEIDAKLKKIESELSGSEERKKAVSAKKYLDSVEENVNKLDAKAFELANAYKEALANQQKLTEQESDLSKTLAEVADQTEAEYLLKKAGEILNKIKSINAEVSRISNEIQAILKEYATIKSTTKAAQAQYTEYGKKYNDLKASKQEERQKIEAELLAIAKKVKPELMELYLKKRAEKLYPILYEANGEICGCCNMQLSMADISKLKNGEVIECDQCRRLLYKGQ